MAYCVQGCLLTWRGHVAQRVEGTPTLDLRNLARRHTLETGHEAVCEITRRAVYRASGEDSWLTARAQQIEGHGGRP